MNLFTPFSCLILLAITPALPAAPASTVLLPEFDFTKAGTAREWGQLHDIEALKPSAEGLQILINGPDPYFSGPARDYPANTPLWLIARLRSDQAGMAEVFYFREGPKAGQSVQFQVPAGRWVEARVPMPALGAGHRLRFDPPGNSGRVLLASLRFEKRLVLPVPTWPDWNPPQPAAQRALASGELELFFSQTAPFAVELRASGQSVAFGHPRLRIAYVMREEVHWLDLSGAVVGMDPAGPGMLSMTARRRDQDGAEWTYRQTFRAGAPGAVVTETTVQVDQDRAVVFLPMHTLLAGEGSFGSHKGQGLLAGLEYLEDEPSSSETDIIGPEANRRVPASHKITFPLMAIQAAGRYVGLIWEDARRFSALFDSPDRTFGSRGHVMSVLFPGADAPSRQEGSLLSDAPQTIKANQPIVSRAWFIGGAGTTVVPAVQQYVQLRGWPSLPDTGLSFSEYVALATQGWLSSKCRETNRYRHAVWPGFQAQPAADAAVFETWLAGRAENPAQSEALRAAAAGALSVVEPRQFYHSAVGHIRSPVAPLVFGEVLAAVKAARQVGLSQLERFSPDGSIPYRRSPNGPDYGKTHFASDANGLTAQVVATLLEAGAFSGDREEIAQGIARLRALAKFRGSVPRGAQTWEIPLHTPDILASAHLVRAYALGYELTGEKEFLDQAIYWAWTGLPFVYLVNPTGQPVGPYSTIPVLGATSWKAPVWFGRPVQWCGMVYADALYWLARQTPAGPWKKLADGITSAALQHTWRADDHQRVGLLPDFFELPSQTRAGPAINPATVGSSAARLYAQGPLYDRRAFPRSGMIVHAPGEVTDPAEEEQRVDFTVRGWPREPYLVLVNGVTNAPVVKIDGRLTPAEFHPPEGCLILKLSGTARVQIGR
ncbi:MAG TPA: hypothetical protein VNU68_04635 [Verrucomicrobiae bacterium]|nr:hypothetical protein [Verrucomicrobiae bacterium]